jgi:hypothetical protein
MVFVVFAKKSSKLFIQTLLFLNDKSNEKFIQLTRINFKRIEKKSFQSKQLRIKAIMI